MTQRGSVCQTLARRIGVVVFIFLCIIVSIFISLSFRKGQLLGIANSKFTHPLYNFNAKIFYQHINLAKNKSRKIFSVIDGAVIPHHTLAGFLIAEFFQDLAYHNPETIILIGPNHTDSGNFKTEISDWGWETPFGTLEPDTSMIYQLIQTQTAMVDNSVFSNEQSIAAVVPYIKYYLPDTKIVPIIIKSSASLKDAQILGVALASMRNDKIVLIASVDFSHYLTRFQAERNDKVTLETIYKSDLSKLFTFDSSYLDSPVAIATLLFTMKEINSSEIEVIAYANSGQLLRNDFIPTTSYYLLTIR